MLAERLNAPPSQAEPCMQLTGTCLRDQDGDVGVWAELCLMAREAALQSSPTAKSFQ